MTKRYLVALLLVGTVPYSLLFSSAVAADRVVVVPLTGTVSGEKPTGNATVQDVLSGKTFSNSTGSDLIGTMPYVGKEDVTPTSSLQSITKGYHDGTGAVLGDEDLTPENIRKGVNIFGISGDFPNSSCTAACEAWCQTNYPTQFPACGQGCITMYLYLTSDSSPCL